MRNIEDELTPELQRAISGDLLDLDELDGGLVEAADRSIFRVNCT